MNKIKIGDLVIVLAGKSKGKQGKVRKINEDRNQVVIEGVNLVKKAKKATQTDQQPGFVEIEAPLHVSNISHYSLAKQKQSRVELS